MASDIHKELQAVANSVGAAHGDAERTICFLAYDEDDRDEVQRFIERFGGDINLLVEGVSEDDDFVARPDDMRYVLQEVEERYLRSSTVTIVLVGRETWRRRFVDWEIAASLDATNDRWTNALLAIWLPSTRGSALLPPRLDRNVTEGMMGYVRTSSPYPKSSAELHDIITTAVEAKEKAVAIDNTPDLMAKDTPPLTS